MTDNSRSTSRRPATELSDVETTHEVLERLRVEVDELRLSRQRMALAGDADRRSLERELHDGVQQRLVTVAVNMELARQLMERDAAGAAEILDDMGREVQRALEDTARLAHRIYPPLLETGGLGAALRAAALAGGLTTEISVSAVSRLPPEIAGAVYFCWLDVLQGAGEGDRATMAVSVDDGAVTFEVGRDAATPLRDDAVARVRDRIEAIGGKLTIESRRGHGVLCAHLPLSR
jgi:signal transduction histidine kinase